MSIPDSPTLRTQPFTVSAWVNQASYQTNAIVMAKTTSRRVSATVVGLMTPVKRSSAAAAAMPARPVSNRAASCSGRLIIDPMSIVSLPGLGLVNRESHKKSVSTVPIRGRSRPFPA